MEVWKSVLGYEDIFEISDLGNLRNKKTGRILKQHINKAGYATVATKIGGRKGRNVCFKIHRLVATAFVPNPENKPEVNHIDGNKKNNAKWNLEWNTSKENVEHAHATGLVTVRRGTECSHSKLTEDAVYYCRENYKPQCKVNGLTALAKRFGVDKKRILEAIRGDSWAHVEFPINAN